MANERTGQLTIYKKLGALQASLILPTRNEKGWVDRDGAVLFEAAAGAGEDKWAWEKKITFAISTADVARLLENQEAPPKIIHKQGETVKALEFVPATDERYAGTYMLNLSSTGTEKSFVKVPLTAGEYQVLMRLIIAALPRMIGWL